jgi:hypothetical protein
MFHDARAMREEPFGSLALGSCVGNLILATVPNGLTGCAFINSACRHLSGLCGFVCGKPDRRP